jgi:hypothetical protein
MFLSQKQISYQSVAVIRETCVTNTVGDAYDECVNQFVAVETEGGPSLVTSLLFVRLDQSNLAVSRKVWPEVSNIVIVAENVRVESGVHRKRHDF